MKNTGLAFCLPGRVYIITRAERERKKRGGGIRETVMVGFKRPGIMDIARSPMFGADDKDNEGKPVTETAVVDDGAAATPSPGAVTFFPNLGAGQDNDAAEMKREERQRRKDSNAPKDGSKPAARARVMRNWLPCVSCCNCCYLALILVFFTYVFLNYVFTFDPTFPPASVPWYEPVPPSPAAWRQSNRYGFWWSVFAAQTSRIVTPIFMLLALLIISAFGGTRLLTAFDLWCVLVIIFEGGLAVFMLIITYTHSKCENTPFCRGFVGDPNKANPIWFFHLWTGFAVVIVHFIFLFLTGRIRKGLEQAQDRFASEKKK